MVHSAAENAIAPEEELRAQMYDFLGALLAAPPDADLLKKTAALQGDDTPIGQSISTLARVAKATHEKAATREFNALFIGLGRGELLPFASYYMTGFLNEKPLAALRNDMRAQQIERAANRFEPEDNIASLLEMMAGMIRGRFRGDVGIDEQRRFFNTHIGPWAEHFFTDLEAARNAVLFAPIGALGRAFIEIEREAFRLAGDSA